jgi:hypothetical protein
MENLISIEQSCIQIFQICRISIIHRRLALALTPICNPGSASISATLHPAWHEYLYLVDDTQNKRHLFTKDFEDHVRIKIQLRSKDKNSINN